MKKSNETKTKEKVVTSSKKGKDKKVVKKAKHYIAEEKTKKNNKEKKDNVFKRIFKYFKGVSKEFKRIRWTERKDLLKYSICTVAFVILFGLYFYAIDWIVLLIRSLAN